MKNYIKYMRRQSKHVQHVHAFIFAGSITSLIAFFILYSEYGFWHEQYVRGGNASLLADGTTTPITLSDQSPASVLSKFLSEARVQFKGVQASSGSLFESKETYTK